MDRFGTVKLYHPEVPEAVFLPLVCFGFENELDPKAAYDCITAYLEAGFLSAPRGVEAGSEVHEAALAVRRQKKNDDNTITPVIDFYPGGRANFKIVSTYLNTDIDIAAFEAASGLKLKGMPLFKGKAAMEKSDEQFVEFGVELPAPLRVLRKLNDKYQPGDTDKAKWWWGGYYNAPHPAPGSAPAAHELSGPEIRVVKALMEERAIPKEVAAELLGITNNWSECKLNGDEALGRLSQWADERDHAATAAEAEADIPF